MGRSQRHKVYIQGYAADDKIRAEGMVAGLGSSVANPPKSLFNYAPGVRAPTISALSPNTSAVNTGTKTVTVTGTNFISGLTQVEIGVVAVATTFVSATSVTFQLNTAQFLAGVQQIKVRNGLYPSNNLPFTFT